MYSDRIKCKMSPKNLLMDTNLKWSADILEGRTPPQLKSFANCDLGFLYDLIEWFWQTLSRSPSPSERLGFHLNKNFQWASQPSTQN